MAAAEDVSFVGPSGAGKSTILHLIARFWDTQTGRVSIGGIDWRELTAEQALQAALAALVRGKTLIVVAHRLSTIRSADQILALDTGRIVHRGHHQKLLIAGGGRRSG